jgi:hypothetical protein
MNFFDKLDNLASIFLKSAQTLGLGESSLSFNDLKVMAANLKSKVEQLVKDNKIEHHIYHWTNPADKLIEALDKMSNGAPVDSNLKASAYEDYNQNVVSLLSVEDQNLLNKLFSFYTIT